MIQLCAGLMVIILIRFKIFNIIDWKISWPKGGKQLFSHRGVKQILKYAMVIFGSSISFWA